MLAILSPILVFGLVIFVHELGHFIAAKAVGVYAPRFSIGFGPAVIATRVIGQVRPLPNAPALAQLQPGDTILSVNGSPVTTWEDIERDMAASRDSIVLRTSRATVRFPVAAGAPSPEEIFSA